MPLCALCQRINIHDLFLMVSNHQSKPFSDHYPYFSNSLDLVASAATCELCTLFASCCFVKADASSSSSTGVESPTRKGDSWIPFMENSSIVDRKFQLRLHENNAMKFSINTCSNFPFGGADEARGIPSLSMWFGKDEGGGRSLYTGFTLYLIAPLSSPAIISGDVGTREYFSRLDSPEALDLMRMWTEACSSHHPNCAVTFTGKKIEDNSPLLPTRVLDVGKSIGNHSIRLHEPQNECGRFTALSHCWGPPDKRPILTTKDTRKNWIQGIPWNQIPKTFQEAILVTQAIGVRYIWIDSLCIVQDDRDDWAREAPQMSHVYQEATLTIIASHAHNSTEGLFGERKSRKHQDLKIPHVTKQGLQQGTIAARVYAGGPVKEPSSPTYEHLWSRGWITPEIVLSRRKLYFTKTSMIWSCRTITQMEDGDSDTTLTRVLEGETGSLEEWNSLVKVYSARKLTYESDRLIAIQGMVNEIQKKTGDEFLVGHWKRQLPLDLLWIVEGDINAIEKRNALGLPSWSWASVMCGVRFAFEREPNLKAQCSVWQVTEATLTIKNAFLLSVVHCSRSWKSIQRKGVFKMPLMQRADDVDLRDSEESEDNESTYEDVENNKKDFGRIEEGIGEEDLKEGDKIIEHTSYDFILKSALPSRKLRVNLEVTFDVGKVEAERLAALDGGSEYQCLAIAKRRLRNRTKTAILLLKPSGDSDSTYSRVGCGTLAAFHNAFRRSQPSTVVLV